MVSPYGGSTLLSCCMSESSSAAAAEGSSGKKHPEENHTMGGPNKQGPNLFGVIGRTSGTVAGFKYTDANKKSAGKASPWVSAEVREQREILGMQLRPPKPAPPSPKPAAPSLKPTPAAPAAPPKLQLPDAVDVAAVAAWESQLLTCDDLAPAAAPKAKNRKQRRAAKQAAVVEDDASERESALSASSTELEAYAALPPTPGSPRPEKKPELQQVSLYEGW